MNCREFVDRLIEEELRQPRRGDRARILRHRLQCVECSRYRQSLDRSTQLVRALASDVPSPQPFPDDLVERILVRAAGTRG